MQCCLEGDLSVLQKFVSRADTDGLYHLHTLVHIFPYAGLIKKISTDHPLWKLSSCMHGEAKIGYFT